jgi:aminoglycoside phosphotransferase (APT) family kinase protein
MSGIKAYQKSYLPKTLDISSNVKLVSAKIREKNPHFLFAAERNAADDVVLVKIITQKGDVSLKQEFTAFGIMNAVKPSQEGFRYPKIYGYDPAVPMVIVDYMNAKSLWKLLHAEKQPKALDPFLKLSVDWLRQLHQIKDEGQSVWTAETAHKVLLSDDRLSEIKSADFKDFAQALLTRLHQEAKSIDDVIIQKTFSHGDIHLDNFLWDGTDLHAIDFSEWAYRVPEYDLAQLVFAFGLHYEGSILDVCAKVSALYPETDMQRLEFLTKVMAVAWLIYFMGRGSKFELKEGATVDTAGKVANVFGLTFPRQS